MEYFIALCEIPPAPAGRHRSYQIRRPARPIPRFLARRRRARQADRVGHQPRRQSHRVHHQGKNGHARTGSLQGIRSLRAYLAGHQQHGHSALAEGGDGGFLLPRRRRGARQTGGFRRRVARGADAGAHARPARFAHDTGQGVHGFRRTHREAAGHAARHRRSGQVRRRDRQLQRTPCGLSAVRLGGIRQQVRRRDAGALPLAVHHADRTLRQLGRDLRQHEAHRHHPHRPLPRHVDLYFDGVLQTADQGRRGRIERHAAQSQSDRLRERRGQLRHRQRPLRTPLVEAPPSRASSATSPTRPCCATSAFRWPTPPLRCDR